MSVAEKKTFVISSNFYNVRKSEHQIVDNGQQQIHFDIPWYLSISKSKSGLGIYLNCEVESDEDWSIEVNVIGEIQKLYESSHTLYASGLVFAEQPLPVDYISWKYIKKHRFITVKCTVTVEKVEGIDFKKRINFDDESRKKFSDVTLIVKDQKFYVNKMFLTSHSKYFESLFLGNFEQSKQSEVELKDIEPEDFQNFLELVHGESVVNAEHIDGILHLADMYDSKTAIKRCEEFMEKSNFSLKERFEMACKYKMDVLKEKCLSEMKTANDIRSIIPEKSDQMENSSLILLLNKSLQLLEKK